MRGRLLIVDDDPSIIAGLEALLSDQWDVSSATSGRDAIRTFGETSPDIVLLDVQLPDTSGLDLLVQFKMYSEITAVIMMSGAGTLDRVIESMKRGAETFLQKPFEYDALEAAIEQASQLAARHREVIALRRGMSGAERIPGTSPAVEKVNEMLASVARAPSPVLIEGESGSGKGVLAKMIHNNSPRAKAPFVDLNCAGLSKELLESELFGHERGAFTGAASTKPGLFEIASDGTLFLDEIGEMEITVQARLLKALEEKRFRRVGGVRDLRADFRLIAATNRDLAAEVSAGRFRADLYFRLNVVRIKMPPLRERLDDLPILAEAILKPLSKEIGRTMPRISPRALEKLKGYAWPGNVRELRNVLERAMLTLAGDEIRTDDLIIEAGSVVAASAGKSGALPQEEWDIRPLEDVTAEYVAAAVKAVDGNMRKAARLLKISPSTLYARLKEPKS
jgi:DNA-binding NtrC family response regulator